MFYVWEYILQNYVEKLQIEVQNLQENYLDAIEKASVLDKELKNAQEKIDSLQKLIDRLQSEFSVFMYPSWVKLFHFIILLRVIF